MINHSTLAIVAIVAALGLLGVVAIESIISIVLPQQHVATAAKSSVGQCASTEKNASAFGCHTLPH